MTTVTNRDVHTRIWGNLTNKDTGTTLELAPGESADVDLPPGFEDLHLQGGVDLPPPGFEDLHLQGGVDLPPPGFEDLQLPGGVDLPPPGFEDLQLPGGVERAPSVPAPAVSLSVSPTEAPVADPGEKE